MQTLLRLSVLALLCVASCDAPALFSKKDTSPVVARVGKVRLTLKMLEERIPAELAESVGPEQKAAFVKQWIDNEIVYQAALAARVDRDEVVRARIERMRRDIIAAEYAGRLAADDPGTQTVSAPTDSALHAWYDAHRGELLRSEGVVRLADIVLPDQATAWSIRNRVTTDNFADLSREAGGSFDGDTAKLPWKTSGELPKELATVVFDIKVGGTIGPVQTSDGFHVIRVVDKRRPGDTLSFDEALPQIRSALGSAPAADRRTRVDDALAGLRSKADFDFNLNVIGASQ